MFYPPEVSHGNCLVGPALLLTRKGGVVEGAAASSTLIASSVRVTRISS